MKTDAVLLLSLFTANVAAYAIGSIGQADPDVIASRPLQLSAREPDPMYDLWKRKGGGAGGAGAGGGHGGGAASGGGRGGGGGAGKGGSSSSSGSSSVGKGSPSSSTGGRTTTDSGPAPRYGGGGYYGGGSTVPYRSGRRSPNGILPFLLVGGALALYPGLWPHGAYLYPFPQPYIYYNSSSNRNETRVVTCLCDPTEECACDDNVSNSTFLSDLIGNGSYAALNQTVIRIADINGTGTIVLNGTLPNGTTATGGTENPNASAGLRTMLQTAGWWPVVAVVCAAVFVA